MRATITRIIAGLAMAGATAALPVSAAPAALKVTVTVSHVQANAGTGSKIGVFAYVSATTTAGASCSGTVDFNHMRITRLPAQSATGGSTTWRYNATVADNPSGRNVGVATVRCTLGARTGKGSRQFVAP